MGERISMGDLLKLTNPLYSLLLMDVWDADGLNGDGTAGTYETLLSKLPIVASLTPGDNLAVCSCLRGPILELSSCLGLDGTLFLRISTIALSAPSEVAERPACALTPSSLSP